jgi:hypothetical protein
MFNQKRLLALVASAAIVSAAPCDIYASGGTPCVAAHSTTRALYSAFNGSLYQVKRADGTTKDIAPIAAGGVANSATQDTFCSGSSCVISIIYDQSGKANHLTQAPPGGAAKGPAANGYDNLAPATGATVYLAGKKVYGVFIAPGTGYRNNHATGTATGDAAEGIYAVLDGTHYNGGCCFDYGNAETSSTDTGAGHMEAVYFGDIGVWGTGAGKGPWIMADLENGLFSGMCFSAGRNASVLIPMQARAQRTTPVTRASPTASSPLSSRASPTSGRSAAATPPPARCRRSTAARGRPATTRCTRRARSSSAPAATTASPPRARSTRAS